MSLSPSHSLFIPSSLCPSPPRSLSFLLSPPPSRPSSFSLLVHLFLLLTPLPPSMFHPSPTPPHIPLASPLSLSLSLFLLSALPSQRGQGSRSGSNLCFLLSAGEDSVYVEMHGDRKPTQTTRDRSGTEPGPQTADEDQTNVFTSRSVQGLAVHKQLHLRHIHSHSYTPQAQTDHTHSCTHGIALFTVLQKHKQRLTEKGSPVFVPFHSVAKIIDRKRVV